MFCKTTLLFLFVFGLAPTRAFRRKSAPSILGLAGSKMRDEYLPICAKDIVKETCDMLVGSLKKGDSDAMLGWLPIDSIKELMAANEESMSGLLKALGFPSDKMPTKEQLAAVSEESKKVLQNYGMKIASNAEGEHFLSIACENLCDMLRDYVEEKYILPPSSDIMGMTTEAGLQWSIDVRPETLNNLWNDGDMPNLEAGDAHAVYGASSASGSHSGNSTGSQQPVGPSQLEYTKYAIVEAVAQLFRFYPVRAATGAESVLQTSVAYEVAQGKHVTSPQEPVLLEFRSDEVVAVGKKGIAYVRNVMRQINLGGSDEKIKDWFGTSTSATKAELLRVMNSVIAVLNNVHYHYKGPTCEDNTFAYVYPTGQENCDSLGSYPDNKIACKTNKEGKYVYYLCDLYLKTDDGEKIETLVHEGSHHHSAYTDDVCSDHYHDVNRDICNSTAYGRDSCAQLAVSDPPRALKNADNHCYFVQALADPAYTRGQRCAKGSRSLSWFVDKDGDCKCPDDSPCHKGDGKCPGSVGLSTKWFAGSCSDCKCKTPAAKQTCPSFAKDSTPDSDGDCVCPVLTTCKSNAAGEDDDCPSYSRGKSAYFFRSSCTTCRCADKPQILLLAAGNIVKAKKQFESSNKEKKTITVGLLGRVSQIDSDGDASIVWEDPVNQQWVLKSGFENLAKLEFHVGNKVKVSTEFDSMNKDKKTLSVGLVGTIINIDEDSDANIDFTESDVDIAKQWVSWKSFGKLKKLETSSKDKACPSGAEGPDNAGDCSCPEPTKCKHKDGGKCWTTAGQQSYGTLFASSCFDCECVTPSTDPTGGTTGTTGGDDDDEDGSPFAHQSIGVALLSMFASMLL